MITEQEETRQDISVLLDAFLSIAPLAERYQDTALAILAVLSSPRETAIAALQVARSGGLFGRYDDALECMLVESTFRISYRRGQRSARFLLPDPEKLWILERMLANYDAIPSIAAGFGRAGHKTVADALAGQMRLMFGTWPYPVLRMYIERVHIEETGGLFIVLAVPFFLELEQEETAQEANVALDASMEGRGLERYGTLYGSNKRVLYSFRMYSGAEHYKPILSAIAGLDLFARDDDAKEIVNYANEMLRACR